MSITQFLRILMVRRMIILGILAAAIVAAMIATIALPPRYPAKARVLMDVIKPDPVSGQVLTSTFAKSYSRTQIELITDYRVAGDVVDKLGWDKIPALVADYQKNSNGTEDFRRYHARNIIDRTSAQLLTSSNILEISYHAGNPILARNVVTALRNSYIDASLRFRTDAAGRSAEWYVDQAAKAQVALSAAEGKKSDFERANGIVMSPGGADSETMKLEQLQGALMAARGAVRSTEVNNTRTELTSGPVIALRAQLNSVEDALAQANDNLGTAHPTYIALVQRRNVLQGQLARESASARSLGGSVASSSASNASLVEADFNAQKAKVLSLKTQLNDLGQLQREVDLRREQYQRAAARAADLKLQSDVSETGLVPLGEAIVTGVPDFPNKPLILALGIAGGLVVGIAAALVTEMISRRVRGPEDLARASKAAVLAVIANAAPIGLGVRIRRLFGLNRSTELQPAQ